MRKSLLRLCVLSAPLLLGACGEGWEFQKNDVMVPYGNQRTAGSGVAYVRAKMMPEKELKVEPVIVKEETQPVVEEVQPIVDAEDIFIKAQTKGGSPVAAKVVSEKAPEELTSKEEQVNVLEPKIEEKIEEEVAHENATLEAPIEAVEPNLEINPHELSAEEHILKSPKEIGELEIQPIDQVINIEPHAGGDDSVLEVYENKVSQPIKEIVVPKRDFFDFKSDGQVSLDEIYGDPLSE